MKKMNRNKTVREAFEEENLPSEMADSVNDFMSEFGITAIDMGEEILLVEDDDEDH